MRNTLKHLKLRFACFFSVLSCCYVISSFFKLRALTGAYFSVISSLLDGQARSKHTPLEFFSLEFFSTLVRTSNFLAGIIFHSRANLELPRGDFFPLSRSLRVPARPVSSHMCLHAQFVSRASDPV